MAIKFIFVTDYVLFLFIARLYTLKYTILHFTTIMNCHAANEVSNHTEKYIPHLFIKKE